MEYQVEDLKREVDIIKNTDKTDVHILISNSVPESFVRACVALGIKTHKTKENSKRLSMVDLSAGIIYNAQEKDALEAILGEDRKIVTYEYNDYDVIDAIIDAYYYNHQD